MGRKTIKQTLSEAGRALGLRKRGVKERSSAAKTLSSRQTIQVADAVKRGDLAEAERLRWEFWPEKMRARELAAGIVKP